MAQNGNNILIMKDGTAIAGARSHEIQNSAGTIEKSSASQQRSRAFVATRNEWTLNVSYLVLSTASAADLLSVGNTYTITQTDREGNILTTGTAIMTLCKQTCTRGHLIQGSFQFRGSGPLT